jgi:PTH1 family peptidyl-tRNA hydrolase
VLHDFARADADWLEPLLDAIADAAPRLANGDAQRFLTDVARQRENGDDENEAPPPRKRRTEEGTPTGQRAERASHPTGERGAKRATALAENLKNWLAKRRPKD